MRLIFMLALLLPVNLSADSYWQRMKNYIAYLIGRPTPTIEPLRKTHPQTFFQYPQTKISSTQTLLKSPTMIGLIGRTPPTSIVLPSNQSELLEIDLRDITTEQINNIIQVAVAHQGANANCGYNALKNAIALGNALYKDNQTYLKMLADPIDPELFSQWSDTIKKYRKKDSADWLEQEEIYELIKSLPSKPSITVIDDVSRLLTGKGLYEKTMDGLIKAQKHLNDNNYVHSFIIGSMNEYGATMGHWFTLVLWISNKKMQFIFADSLSNHSLSSRLNSVQEFIKALTTKNFKTFKAIEGMEKFLTKIDLASEILEKREYAKKDSQNTQKPTIDREIEQLPQFILANISYAIKAAETADILRTVEFVEKRDLIEKTLNDLQKANGQIFKIYSDTTADAEVKRSPFKLSTDEENRAIPQLLHSLYPGSSN